MANGILTTWLLDSRSARQLGLVSTGHASRGTGGPPSPGPTFLITNERAFVATTGPVTPPRVERIAPEAVRTALIWQGPSLVFAATPLAEVAAQFNRRNPIQIVLADPALATLPIGGSFRPEHVEAFVQLLESGNEILVDRSDATRLVLRAAK